MKDGGPAFPQPKATFNHADGTPDFYEGVPGMSLRDYFAAAALTGLLAGYTKESDMSELAECGIIRNQPQSMAELAYLHADTMLAVRGES